MQKAVLYVRVSTDEQADKGYSLANQQEHLIKFCATQGIEILKIYIEDHSAKNFERPEFRKFLEYAKQNQRNIDLLLCYAWDRFSRNVTDAYEMLAKLKKMSIEVQAITQPLDLSIPQNKLLLAVYLTLPEVDNDIRADRARSGHRGARRAGRWTGMAPIGYKNSRDEFNKALIVPDHRAELVKWVFEEVAKNERTLNEIRLELHSKGLYITRSNFSVLVRNTIYAGKVLVKATKDQPEELIVGLHQPIVSDDLFCEVQNILSGRKKKQNKQISFRDHDELPLRGLLCCSKCGNHVTGSASRSRNGQRHYYYHCMKCKKERFRAEKANNEMEKLLSTIQISEGIETIYKRILDEELKENPQRLGQQKSTLTQELNKLEERKDKLQNMLLDGHLNPQDYSELKRKLEDQISEVKNDLKRFEEAKDISKDQFNEKLQTLANLLEWYKSKGVQDKKRFLSSIFPEKFIFDGFYVRTEEIDSTVALLLSKTKDFDPKQKGHMGYKSHVTLLVPKTGVEPAHP